MRRLSFAIQAALLLAILTAPLVHATLLTPATSCDPCVTVTGNTATPGTVVADTGVEAWSITNSITHAVVDAGTFEQQVIKTSGGTLDFYYQVSVSKGDIETVSTFSFAGWDTTCCVTGTASPGVDVGVNTSYSVFSPSNLGTISPNAAKGTGALDDGFGDINFGFGTGVITAGKTSVTLVIDTAATAFQAGGTGIIDSGVADVNSFAPGPEPSSLALFSIVLLVGGVSLRRSLARR